MWIHSVLESLRVGRSGGEIASCWERLLGTPSFKDMLSGGFGAKLGRDDRAGSVVKAQAEESF
jgi:hypothetical protein